MLGQFLRGVSIFMIDFTKPAKLVMVGRLADM